MNQHQRMYWLCQLGGWLGYAAINCLFMAGFYHLTVPLVLANVFVSAVGLIGTDAFRIAIRRHDMLSWPLLRLIPIILFKTLLVAAIMECGVFLSSHFVPDAPREFRFAVTLARMFNFSVVALLWSVIYFSIHFFQDRKNSQIKNLKLESALKDAELMTLKSQMNPHFLFNALNSIRALAGSDGARAQEAITKLANILRYALQNAAAPEVTLQDELQTVQDYVALEKIRFEERFNVTWRTAPGLEQIKIPSMLIQMLVENAIKYGIADRTQGGTVIIQTERIGSTLEITVINDGHVRQTDASTGIGNANIRQRLALLYGSSATLELTEKNAQVYAKVKIPIREEKP